MFKSFCLIDSHVHYALPIEYGELTKAMELTGADKMTLVTVPDRNRLLTTPEALMMKAHDENKFYVFTSLDVSEYFKHGRQFGKYMARYVDRALKFGCDGVKMIEGKPSVRKMLQIIPFDDERWEPYWCYAEQIGLPILWHVNDPSEFWDKDKISTWAKSKGWYYDESYVSSSRQYDEVFNVLKRHPNLKITFAHFFFLSDNLGRLQTILDAYPNVNVDITPGIEMYVNLSSCPDKARDFFIKNSTRIIYGTDIGARAVLKVGSNINFEECVSRSGLIKSFLSETDKVTVKADGNFLIGTEDFQLNCIGLPDDVLKNIFAQNFGRFVGKSNKVQPKAVINECRRIKLTVWIMSLFDKQIKPDYSCADKVIKYFNKGEK